MSIVSSVEFSLGDSMIGLHVCQARRALMIAACLQVMESDQILPAPLSTGPYRLIGRLSANLRLVAHPSINIP